VTVLDRVQVALPPGGHFIVTFGVRDPGGEFIRVCYVEGDSAAFFRTDTGALDSLVLNHPSAEAVLRAVRVSVIATPTPVLATRSAPTPTSTASVSPPGTGSGGLR